MKVKIFMPIPIGYKLSRYDLPYRLAGNLEKEICHGHPTSYLRSSLLSDGKRHASTCLRPFPGLAKTLNETDAGWRLPAGIIKEFFRICEVNMSKKYRSAVSGRYVTESFAKKHSRETVGEKSESTRKKK